MVLKRKETKPPDDDYFFVWVQRLNFSKTLSVLTTTLF